MQLTKNQIDGIYVQLGALASVCDNAESQDGQGFSKADLVGHYISELPRSFFNEEIGLVSLLLIRKYQKQLKDMGHNPQPFIDLIKQEHAADYENAQLNRRSISQRRLRLTSSGDFEIYFPNKSKMFGFNSALPNGFDWIEEQKIPHGYLFIVKRGARAFVENTVANFSNWLMSDMAETALTDTSLDSIDVKHALKYDLNISGEYAANLVLDWPNTRVYLDRIRKFSKRRFNGVDAWNVNIQTVADVDLLREMVEEEGKTVLLSDSVEKLLSDWELLRSDIELQENERAQLAKEKEYRERPVANVGLIENAFIIKFSSFSWSLVNWVKAELNNKSFNRDTKDWNVEYSEQNIVALHNKLQDENWIFSTSATKHIEDAYLKAANDLQKEAENKELSLYISTLKEPTEGFTCDLSKINGNPFPFQLVVAEYNQRRQNLLIADEMGLGKSLASLICATNNHLDDSVIVMCPAIARLTWRNEIDKWLFDKSVYICRKANSKKNAAKEREAIQAANFVVVSYNKAEVYREELKLKESKLFIGDESQYLKNEKAKRTKAAMSVSDTCDHVYLLSGTAMKNRPKELITQLTMLGIFESEFGGFFEFTRKYCDGHNNGWGYVFDGASNLSELRERLRQTCMVRRKKDDVMELLPPKRRIRIPIEIDNRKEYDKANTDFVAALKKNAKAKATLAAKKEKPAKRKKFIENYVKRTVASALKAQALTHINTLRKIVAAGVQNAACDWISEYASCDDPLVVFVYHKEQQKFIYDQLKGKGLRVGKIVSGMSDEARKQTENDFQNGLYDVVICALMSANTNITLTAASRCITIEYDWVPGEHLQAEDRIRRIGTSINIESIDCYYFHAQDTVYDHFWNVIIGKLSDIEKAMDSDSVTEYELSDDEARADIIKGFMNDFDFIKEAA